MTGGEGAHGSVVCERYGDKEGVHSVPRGEEKLVAALGTKWSPERAPAMSFGGGTVRPNYATANPGKRGSREVSGGTVSSP